MYAIVRLRGTVKTKPEIKDTLRSIQVEFGNEFGSPLLLVGGCLLVLFSVKFMRHICSAEWFADERREASGSIRWLCATSEPDSVPPCRLQLFAADPGCHRLLLSETGTSRPAHAHPLRNSSATAGFLIASTSCPSGLLNTRPFP